VWVKDASRSVPVASALLSDQQRPRFMDDVKADFDSIRERHAARNKARPLTSLERARENASPIDWSGYHPPKPRMLARQDKDVWSHGPAAGTAKQFVRAFHDYDLAELRHYIDWQPFFSAWEMRGKFPDILNNPSSGEAARKLWEDAQQMLDRVIEEGWLRANGVVGLFPANRVEGEDIEVYTDESRTAVLTTLHQLRQQGEHRHGLPHRSIADFIAPKETNVADFVGGFAVTAGLGAQEKIQEFKAALDDYSAILLESLADRLAEAFAERLHERVRKELWGYAPDEHLDSAGLLKEQYAGIRPAPGYPACPDHTEKATLWELLDVEANTGITLTDSMAMWPGAAVSGFYFSHPESQYFVLGRLGPDQVADYARRKGWTVKEAERWLSPNLGYEPED
jgi:5-methyltetrahydrofolate--homocysteine methyltransferase